MNLNQQTLLFDLDGTLSDPLLGFAKSVNIALQAHDLASLPECDLAQYIGPPLDGTLRRITGRDDPAFIASLVAKYREYYLDTGFREARLYSGVAEALAELQRGGHRLAVCTSKPEPSARLVLEHFGLLPYFEFVSGGDVGVAKWQQIEQLLADKIITASALMIGDRAVDLQAGHRNGISSAGVLWGYGSLAELQAEAPAHFFEHPDDWLTFQNV
ncbi:MAG: HAD family hydrolase [Granulosicoccaceae bacterium]